MTTLIFIILAVIAAYELSGIIADYIQDRWMFTGHGIRRRWFGAGCQVAVRYADIRTVIRWDAEHREPVFVKLLDRDGDVDWMPVHRLTPVSVPVFRPRLSRDGIRLTAQRPSGEIPR